MMILRSGTRLSHAVALLLLQGCASDLAEVGIWRGAVADGTASDVAGVVAILEDAGGGACGGAVVGDRWVVTPAFCAEGQNLVVIVGTDLDQGTPFAVDEVQSGPPVPVGGGDVAVALLRTTDDLGVPALSLSRAIPAVGDIYTAVGFGRRNGGTGPRSQGQIRLVDVEDSSYTSESADGSVRCYTDNVELDPDGRLAGLSIRGTMTPEGDCFDQTLSMRVSAFLDFVESSIGPAPDGGAPGEDAGLPEIDAGLPDRDAATDDVDAGDPGPDSGVGDAGDAGASGGGGGCDCRVGAGRGRDAHAPWIVLVALAVVAMRRRG